MKRIVIAFFVLFIFSYPVFLSAGEGQYGVRLAVSDDGIFLLSIKEISSGIHVRQKSLKGRDAFSFEVQNSDGELVHSGGFADPRLVSALFGSSFLTSKENRNPHIRLESGIAFVRLPESSLGGELQIFARGAGQKTAKGRMLASFGIVPDGQTKAAEFDKETLEDNGPAENRLDIVVLGDGYTLEQQDELTQNAEDFVESFASQQPWSDYRKFFNFHLVHVVSAESGADHPSQDRYVDTALDSTFDYMGLERLLVSDFEKTIEAADTVDGWDYIFVLVNDYTYGGSGTAGYMAVTSLNQYAPEIVVHESGHMVAGLADEYEDPWDGFEPAEDEPNITTDSNPENLKWSVWVGENIPLPTPEAAKYESAIGMFEGARYQAQDIYRPKMNCKMRELGQPFCEVCREALIEALYENISPCDSVGGDIALYPGDEYILQLDLLETAADSISVEWYLDDEILSKRDDKLVVNADELGMGSYVITAHVQDINPMLKREGALLAAGETIVWNVLVQEEGTSDGDETESDMETDAHEDGDLEEIDGDIDSDQAELEASDSGSGDGTGDDGCSTISGLSPFAAFCLLIFGLVAILRRIANCTCKNV